MSRLLVFPMPILNAGTPSRRFASAECDDRLDRPVRNAGCRLIDDTTVLVTTDDPTPTCGR
jgi:hypothetical protein